MLYSNCFSCGPAVALTVFQLACDMCKGSQFECDLADLQVLLLSLQCRQICCLKTAHLHLQNLKCSLETAEPKMENL